MGKMSNEQAYQAAINLAREQLQVLTIVIAPILHSGTFHSSSAEILDKMLAFQKTRRVHDTGSVGNIIANSAPNEVMLDFDGANQALLNNPAQKIICLRAVVGNALLAVGMYFKEHGMAAMRTPEIQFLDHVCEALLNGNRFNLDPGYMPIATFDGLVIDSKLNDGLLFGDGVTPGFMEFGDGIALLQWLLRYLEGGKHFVTGGDAG